MVGSGSSSRSGGRSSRSRSSSGEPCVCVYLSKRHHRIGPTTVADAAYCGGPGHA